MYPQLSFTFKHIIINPSSILSSESRSMIVKKIGKKFNDVTAINILAPREPFKVKQAGKLSHNGDN